MALLRTKASMEKELNFKYDACNRFIRELGSVRDDLSTILEMHKRIWKHGVQHPNFGPDEYGMFRTNDILSMSGDEVFLGTPNLLYNTLTYWEDRKDREISEMRRNGKPVVLPDYYVALCRKYKDHLKDNLKMMRAQVFDNGIGREQLCHNITEALNKMGEYNQSSVTSYGGMEILNTSIADNRILNCRFSYRGKQVNSSFLNLSGRFLIPEGFEKGVQLNPKNAKLFKYIDAMDTLYNDGEAKIIDLEAESSKVLKTGSLLRDLSRSEAKENIENVRKAEKRGFKFGI